VAPTANTLARTGGLEAIPMAEPIGDATTLVRQRLWQLLSPTLPIGAYSYSGGLESAIAAGWVNHADAVHDWVAGLLRHNLARVDVPLLVRLHQSWRSGDQAAVERHAAWLRACRDSAEFAAEDRQLGRALATLLADLGVDAARPWVSKPLTGWAVMYALALAHWGIALREGVEGYLWSWCENQVAAAVKLVPLGQTDGQRLLLGLANTLVEAAEVGMALDDEAIGGSAPGLAISSCWHETQYSRLFRS
jgi:urease accessory protein